MSSATVVKQFNLPDLGEGLADAVLVSWRVKVGDDIALNDVIAEVETAKATVELPSPYAGTVSALSASENDVVQVGAPLISVAVANTAEESESAAVEENSNLVGYGPGAGTSNRRRRRGAAPRPHATTASLPPAVAPEKPIELPPMLTRPSAKPSVRKMANELGIDLDQVTGTGIEGTITRQDIESYVRDRGAVAPVHTGDHVPVTGIRRAMASAMSRSATEAPQATLFLTVDATQTRTWISELKAKRGYDGLGPLAVVAKAVAGLLSRHRYLNASWDDSGEVVLHPHVNLGIAADTPGGLIVPQIKQAQTLSLAELNAALMDLKNVAREGKTPPSSMTGGTFTITNVGVFGVDAGTPILNPGEAAILAVGALSRRPWVVGDDIVARDVMTLTLTIDHRIVDGGQGSRFLADLGAILTDPRAALAF